MGTGSLSTQKREISARRRKKEEAGQERRRETGQSKSRLGSEKRQRARATGETYPWEEGRVKRMPSRH